MLNKKGLREEFNNSILVDNGKNNIGENFIYVTLGNELKVYSNPVLDLKESNPTERIIIPEDGYILDPNKWYLGRTNEYTETYEFVPKLENLEELAIMGFDAHITAGFGDNGFKGTWTLEIKCAKPILIKPGMKVGLLAYHSLIGDSSIKYEGKYLGQIEATESRIERDFQKTLGGKKC